MNIMKTILIDDEPMALEVLKHMLSPYKEIDILASYTHPSDALNNIKEIKPEVIFLDIEMGEINGLELAEIIMGELEDVEIVFVTAYSQYAVDAFEINAIDYLLKPIQEKRLSKAIGRLNERKKEKESYSRDMNVSNKLKISSFGGFQLVDSRGKPLNWRTRKSKELFAYLWTRKKQISSKDVIIEAVFPNRELEKASTLLHTTVYQLRKNLEKRGYINAIIYSEEGYKLNISIESDIEELISITEKERYDEEDIWEILKIYKGDFLEEGYHWAMEMQQMFRQLFFKFLEKFVKIEMQNERFSLVLKSALDKLYQIDPLSNSAILMIIKYYGKQRETVKLEKFFKDYEFELFEEMRLEPIKEIKDAYNKYI